MKKLFTILAAALSVFTLQADELMLNLKPIGKILADNGKFNAKYSRSFVNDKDKVISELSLNKGRFYTHKKHKHISGYNADYSFMLTVPGNLNKVAVETDITNYSDGRERILEVEYSIDGMTFSKLAPVVFKGGNTVFKHTFDIQGKSDRLQVRFSRREKNEKRVLG